jgi:hypothetical protein
LTTGIPHPSVTCGLSISLKADLTPLQFHWGSERFDEGRNMAVIVGMPQGGIILTREEWEKRVPVLEVEKRLKKRAELCRIITAYITLPTGLSYELAFQD